MGTASALDIRASELDPADMMSRLPDSVLSHTLSFLPTKYAVATSVLSKRWRFLWTQVHSFYFDDNLPRIHQRVDQAAGQRMTFSESVEKVMLLRNAQFSMEKFHIKCSRCNDIHNHINGWISSVIVAGVRNLSLSVHRGLMIPLPQQLYTSNRLVELKLSGGALIIKEEQAFFPYLKTLHLCSVAYQNDAAFRQLISSCSVLENLLIRRSREDYMVNFDISSHTVKRVDIYIYSNATLNIKRRHLALKLDTPQLQFLTIWGHLDEMYKVKELPSLKEANIHARQDSGFDFFGSLQNIKVLSLSTISMQHQGPIGQELFGTIFKSFRNLTHLTLEAPFCLRGHLQHIFEKTDNLESLTYYENEVSSHSPPNWIRRSLLEVEKARMSRLSSVSIVGFTGGRCNMELARYILEDAKLLTKMEIKCRSETSVGDKFNILRKISEMPRVSPTCKITFS